MSRRSPCPSAASPASPAQLRPDTGLWSIWWISSLEGRLRPPVTGGFENGVGLFEGDDLDDDRPIRARYVWSDITPALGPLDPELLAGRRRDLGGQLGDGLHAGGGRGMSLNQAWSNCASTG
jgi:hypothetical protein